MVGWIIGIIAGVIIIMIIIKIATRNRGEDSDEEEGDIWSQIRKVKRGACKKFKDVLFGC